MTPPFRAWPKIPRWNRDVTITEKIDGTNACVVVTEDELVYAQSRKRLITPQQDNFGFAAWVDDHTEELRELGQGYHFGEWYGKGIQRGYGLDERRFALFNTDRWSDDRPACCGVVPVLWRGTAEILDYGISVSRGYLHLHGSYAAHGFRNPEGFVIYHHAGNHTYKVLLENDDIPKGKAA